MKAMILAAGLGTRLRPLTQNTPKALVMVHGQPLIYYALQLLAQHGFKEVLINLHYLGELIQKELGQGDQLGLRITYSYETELLGTGGGIRNAECYFEDKPFLVINSDILIDLNLRELVDFHQKKGGIATMVVRPQSYQQNYTPILLGNRNRIAGIGQAAKEGDILTQDRLMYTGVQILEPKLLQYLPRNRSACLIGEGYQPAIAADEKIFGFVHEGYWNDLGTIDRLRQAELELSEQNFSYLKIPKHQS